MENFLSLFMSMVIEIQRIPEERVLSDENVYVGLMSAGIILNFIFLVTWGVILAFLTI